MALTDTWLRANSGKARSVVEEVSDRDSLSVRVSPKGTSAPLALPYNVMQWLRRHEKYEMEHWSIHDLRKTARTNFSTLTEPHIAEIMLGHRLPGTWQVYDRYDYLPEQAKALEAWTERLKTLVGDDALPGLSEPARNSHKS